MLAKLYMSPTLYMMYYSAMHQYLEVEFSVHSSQPSHCIMLSRHSGISHLQNTSISWFGNHGYGGTRARLCECGKGVSFCLVKHLAKCCRILSCSNSISSKLSPLAAWKAYATAYIYSTVYRNRLQVQLNLAVHAVHLALGLINA